MPYETLITPAILKQHLASDNWQIIDCRFNLTAPEAGHQEYLEAHIPGALYAHLDHDLSSPIRATTGRHPLPERETLQEKFSAWGIDSSTQVVVYDSSNGMMAARLWWLLRWMGHSSVALLDGGLSRWLREKNMLTAELPESRPRRFVARAPLERFITSDEVLARLAAPEHLLIDVRAAERYAGEVEPLDRVAGHIPGALNLPLQESLDSEGKFRSPEQLKVIFQNAIGDISPRNVSVMCGSGVTACHTLLALRVAGIEGATLYAGSWSEWISDPQRPVVTRADYQP
ncbi:MAG TPA: sulfurtransferase [Gammaproteobacteria bacterium]